MLLLHNIYRGTTFLVIILLRADETSYAVNLLFVMCRLFIYTVKVVTSRFISHELVWKYNCILSAFQSGEPDGLCVRPEASEQAAGGRLEVGRLQRQRALRHVVLGRLHRPARHTAAPADQGRPRPRQPAQQRGRTEGKHWSRGYNDDNGDNSSNNNNSNSINNNSCNNCNNNDNDYDNKNSNKIKNIASLPIIERTREFRTLKVAYLHRFGRSVCYKRRCAYCLLLLIIMIMMIVMMMMMMIIIMMMMMIIIIRKKKNIIPTIQITITLIIINIILIIPPYS